MLDTIFRGTTHYSVVILSLIPLSKLAQAFTQSGRGFETEVTLEGRGVGIGYGDISWSFDKLRMYRMGLLRFT